MADNLLIVLITGANQGIGYFAAEQFAATGKHYVLLGSRDKARGQKAVDELVSAGTSSDRLEAVEIDINSDESIDAAVANVEKNFGRLDILVNNAGISNVPNVSPREEYKQIFNTNLFGTIACTQAFVPLLRHSTAPAGKRVIFVSSTVATFEYAADAKAAGKNYLPAKLYPIYRSSKSALNMVMLGLAETLGEEGFTVGGICPGYCATNLNGHQGHKDPRDGAKIIIDNSKTEKEKVHAKVINENGVLPW